MIFFENLLHLSSFAAAVAPSADLITVIERAMAELDENASRDFAGALVGHPS